MGHQAVRRKEKLEREIGAKLIRKWILDGAGPARFGWGSLYPSGKIRWEGRTLDEVEHKAFREAEEDKARWRKDGY